MVLPFMSNAASSSSTVELPRVLSEDEQLALSIEQTAYEVTSSSRCRRPSETTVRATRRVLLDCGSLFSRSSPLDGCSIFAKRYVQAFRASFRSAVFRSQSKEAGIRTLVMLDEQGGE